MRWRVQRAPGSCVCVRVQNPKSILGYSIGELEAGVPKPDGSRQLYQLLPSQEEDYPCSYLYIKDLRHNSLERLGAFVVYKEMRISEAGRKLRSKEEVLADKVKGRQEAAEAMNKRKHAALLEMHRHATMPRELEIDSPEFWRNVLQGFPSDDGLRLIADRVRPAACACLVANRHFIP